MFRLQVWWNALRLFKDFQYLHFCASAAWNIFAFTFIDAVFLFPHHANNLMKCKKPKKLSDIALLVRKIIKLSDPLWTHLYVFNDMSPNFSTIIRTCGKRLQLDLGLEALNFCVPSEYLVCVMSVI